jgi:alkanesulfonate monooxygenase SsuD/methylene tetrahydromethanopterin reductase-like flavin-dependent oxidoreductase (luciferase family)
LPAPGDPGIIRGAAVRAEQLGYESVWVSDHVVVPRANIVNFGETSSIGFFGFPLGVIAGVEPGAARDHRAQSCRTRTRWSRPR